MRRAPLRIQSAPGRLLLLAPVWLLLGGRALAAVFGLEVGALPMDVLFGTTLVAIATYGVLVWRLAMNEHDAQKDELN